MSSAFTVSRTFDTHRERQWRTDIRVAVGSPTSRKPRSPVVKVPALEPLTPIPSTRSPTRRKVPPMSPAMRTIHLRPHDQPAFLVSSNDLRCGVIALLGEAARHFDHSESAKSAGTRARQHAAFRAAFTETRDLLDALKDAPLFDHCEEDRVAWAGENFAIYREALQRVADRKLFFPPVADRLEAEDSIEFW